MNKATHKKTGSDSSHSRHIRCFKYRNLGQSVKPAF